MAFQAQDAKTISWFYAAAFGRTPVPDSTLPDDGDLGGIIFWTDAYLGGNPDLPQFSASSYADPLQALYAMGDFFVASDEFQARYPDGLTNEQFVTALYNNMLDRDPDLTGFDFWVAKLDSGDSRGTVLVDFANTYENQHAIPNQSEALDSYILFIANDNSMPNPVITPDEAATWLAANPEYDAAVVDLPLDTTAPTIDPDQTATYSEGSTADATLLALVAADNEGGSGIDSFAIVSGDDHHYFQIDASGNISLTTAGAEAGTASNDAAVDPDTFTLGVTATDRAGNTSAAVDVVLTVADLTPPALSQALVGTGNTLVLGYSETLASSKLPLPTDFAVTQNGTTSITVNTVTISGSSVILGLASAPTGTVTVSYTPNADVNKELQDASGNVAAALTNQATQADTTAPTLASSVPADNATDVAVGSNLVLTMSETVKAGTGNIIITNSNDATDTRTISVTDTTQVTFSGSSITINPTADLKAGAAYVVTMGSGVVTDLVGNAFAGLSGADLNFSTPGASTAGQTFTLTTGIDAIPGLIGSLGTTDTAGDDIIIGSVDKTNGTLTTVQVADQVNAGTGVDTFKEFINGGAINAVLPQLSNVENIFISGNNDIGLNVSAIAGVTGLEINQPGQLKTYTLNGATQDFTLSQDGNAPGATVQGANLVYGSTNTSAKVTVAAVGNLNNTGVYSSTIDVAGANLATVNLVSTGDLAGSSNHAASGLLVNMAAANLVTLKDTSGATTPSISKITVTGDSALLLALDKNGDIQTDLSKVATIDASTDTGGVTVVAADWTDGKNNGMDSKLLPSSFTFTGGSGNDVLMLAQGQLSALTSGAQLDGGAGTDTLVINELAASIADPSAGATIYTAINAAKNFEVLGVGAGANGATIDITKLNTINKFYDGDYAGAMTFTGANSASQFQIDNTLGQMAVTIQNAVGQDTTTINVDNQSGNAATVTALTVNNGIHTINLSSTGNVGATNIITTLTNDDNAVINVTGDHALTITAPLVGTSTGSTVDAHLFTASLTVTGSVKNDVIIGGTKGDVITGSAGADVLTGNGGSDKFGYTGGSADSNIGMLDHITDLVLGNSGDKLGVTTAPTVILNAGSAFTGAVNAATIGTNLANVGSVLAGGEAYLFTANAGDLSGHTFLVYNTTADAVINASDLVIDVTGVSGTLVSANFVV